MLAILPMTWLAEIYNATLSLPPALPPRCGMAHVGLMPGKGRGQSSTIIASFRPDRVSDTCTITPVFMDHHLVQGKWPWSTMETRFRSKYFRHLRQAKHSSPKVGGLSSHCTCISLQISDPELTRATPPALHLPKIKRKKMSNYPTKAAVYEVYAVN